MSNGHFKVIRSSQFLRQQTLFVCFNKNQITLHFWSVGYLIHWLCDIIIIIIIIQSNRYPILSLSDLIILWSYHYPILSLSDLIVIRSYRYPILSFSDLIVIQSNRYLIQSSSNSFVIHSIFIRQGYDGFKSCFLKISPKQ